MKFLISHDRFYDVSGQLGFMAFGVSGQSGFTWMTFLISQVL